MKTKVILSILTAFCLSLFLGGAVAAATSSTVGLCTAGAVFSFTLLTPSTEGLLSLKAGGNVFPTSNRRAVYDFISDKYQQSDIVITDSYLRLETSLQGSFTSIPFSMLTNQSPAANVTEKRLALTDKFCATDICVYIMKAGASVAATDAEKTVARLRSYPNNTVFSGANEAANLGAIYNGSMQIKINGKVYIDSLDLLRFYRVPVSQKGAAVSTVATTGVLQEDGFDNLNYGFAPLTPTLLFDGLGKNDISVNLPSSTTLSGTTSQNFAVVVLRGFLLQNAAGK